MRKKEPRSCADTELGSYHKAVGYIQPNVITRLRDMAGQENCDGCARLLPVVGGLHRDEKGAVQTCTANRYT